MFSFLSIIIAVPAKFLTEPKKSITAYKSWDTVLKCDIFGYPAPVIRWTRTHNQVLTKRHIIDGTELRVENTTEGDSGAYLCEGTNELGSVLSVTWIIVKDSGRHTLKDSIIVKIILSVGHRIFFFFFSVDPFIVSSPSSEVQVPNVGDSVKLNCSARGSPLPKVKWFKDGRRAIATAMHDGKDLIKSEIVIDRFKPSDAGNYTCLFYNDKNETAEANTTLSN